ncbi:SCO family protein [Xylophilus sp. ASV27]|uniref:SCO family protein n=1 Tax=Xylophilus sp. ASV27 TaxID=2795129 RepID=UPI0018EC5F8D|nr:SCO family protein [Xylophilus sp. ASV27]
MPTRRLVLASAAAAALAACSKSAPGPGFHAVDITGADYARDFSLADQFGKTRSLADFKGKVVVVFFGFTQCPDVCPTTMAELAEVKRQLGADGERLQAIFISVDPERDTPEVLKAYMENFDPGFIALRPTPEQLPAVAKDYKIYYKKVEGKQPGSYSMDHSAGSYLYDPQGRLRLYSRYGSPSTDLLADIKVLLAA